MTLSDSAGTGALPLRATGLRLTISGFIRWTGSGFTRALAAAAEDLDRAAEREGPGPLALLLARRPWRLAISAQVGRADHVCTVW